MPVWFMVTGLSNEYMVALALDLTVWLFSRDRAVVQLVVGNFSPCTLYSTICPAPTDRPGPGASSQLSIKAAWEDFLLSAWRSLEHLPSEQHQHRGAFVCFRNVRQGSWFLKFMNCMEWNVLSPSTRKKQRGCVFMTPKLWVISGKSPVRLFIGNGVDFPPSSKKKKKKGERLCF